MSDHRWRRDPMGRPYDPYRGFDERGRTGGGHIPDESGYDRSTDRRGASDQDANALALFGGENGTAVAYAVKDARPTAPGLSEARSSADVEERLRSVRELEAKGLVTAEQAAERVEEILRDV